MECERYFFYFFGRRRQKTHQQRKEEKRKKVLFNVYFKLLLLWFFWLFSLSCVVFCFHNGVSPSSSFKRNRDREFWTSVLRLSTYRATQSTHSTTRHHQTTWQKIYINFSAHENVLLLIYLWKKSSSRHFSTPVL